MLSRTLLVVIFVSACTSRAQPLPAPSRAPSPASSQGPVTVSANTTGSLGSLCSSEAGLRTAVQAAAGLRDSAGLNITIPAALRHSADVQQIAQVAWNYIVTYPLPLIAKSVAAATANGTAVNSFFLSNDHLSNYNDTGGVTPNHDTLYNQAFLDLSQGPQVITVPEFDAGRYWIVPFLDAYLNYYGAIGSHFDSPPGEYLVVGPDTPADATFDNFTSSRIFRSPTYLNWVIGRVLVLEDTPEGIKEAYDLSESYEINPYDSAVDGSRNRSSKAAIISRAVNGSGYGAYKNSVGFLDGFIRHPAQWFSASARFLTTDPPANQSTNFEAAALQILARTAVRSPAAFDLGRQVAEKCIVAGNTALVTRTGWTFHNTSGVYQTPAGTDYLLRAQDARLIPAALPPSEVIYFLTNRDSEGRPLDASTGANYTITFSLPLPAQAWWSLTIYNATNLLLFKNSINRYSIGDRTRNMIYSGANGGNNTLEIFISASAPREGTEQYANWLPAPTNAPFELILRTYEPPRSAIAGRYAPPALVRIPPAGTVSSAGR